MPCFNLSSTVKHAVLHHPSPPKTLPHCVWVTFNNLNPKMVTIDNGMIKKACLHNLHVNEVPPCGADQPALQHLTTKSGACGKSKENSSENLWQGEIVKDIGEELCEAASHVKERRQPWSRSHLLHFCAPGKRVGFDF